PYAGSTYTVDLDVPASSVVGAVGYVLLDRRPLRFALAGGAGYYLTTGEFVTRGPGVHDRSSLEGSAFGFHGMGLLLAQVASGGRRMFLSVQPRGLHSGWMRRPCVLLSTCGSHPRGRERDANFFPTDGSDHAPGRWARGRDAPDRRWRGPPGPREFHEAVGRC